MADEIRLSAIALGQLEAWLPSDLTEQQLDKVMTAVAAVASQVWREAADATRTIERMRREARQQPIRSESDRSE